MCPVARWVQTPPEPTSYAQPLPPTIDTLRRTRWSITLRRSAMPASREASPSSRGAVRRRARRCAEYSDSRHCGAVKNGIDGDRCQRRRADRSVGALRGLRAGRRGGSRARTRRCLRTASSTRPVHGRSRRSSMVWWAGYRHRWTSIPSRWRPPDDRRRAATTASDYGVSPQPAQAPEKSNSGSRYCVPRYRAEVHPRPVVDRQGLEEPVPLIARRRRNEIDAVTRIRWSGSRQGRTARDRSVGSPTRGRPDDHDQPCLGQDGPVGRIVGRRSVVHIVVDGDSGAGSRRMDSVAGEEPLEIRVGPAG